MNDTSWPATVQARLRDFADQRDWAPFHTPRNLLLALMGEVGELAEIYQWDPKSVDTTRVAEEVADVLIYALRFADVAGIDVEAAVDAKIQANGQRYEAEAWRGRAGKAD
jgi:dCTP diphosphatase